MKIRVPGKQYQIQRFYIFIVAVSLMKLVLMGFFSSDYQDSMFMRFIHGFLRQLGNGHLVNPYEYFKDEAGLFPYPPMMLVMECVGGIPSMLVGNNVFLRNILFKLPALFFDCLGMYWLMKIFPEKRKDIAILYFASPIIFYSTYMHGQLDIIPTTFLIGAIMHLTSRKRNDLKYMLLLAAALLCKLHILAAVPVLFLFISKRDGWGKAATMTLLPIFLTAMCILPFWGNGFLYNVLLNNEQSVLTKIYFDFAGVRIYIPIMAVLLIYLKVFTMGKVNRDLLYSLLGILFSVFLVLVPPMPGWYVWIVPFITIFFIDIRSNRYINLVVFVVLNLSYLLYFILAHQTAYVDLYFLGRSLDGLKTNNSMVVNGLFTLLTAVLLYSIYMMYQSGITSNSLYKRRNQPFIIGVAGDSGSGKSTFTAMVEQLFGSKNLLFIEGDGDHRWERGNAMWEHFTHLNPRSNYLYRQARDLEKLRNGESIMRVDYNHETGEFTKAKKIKGRPYILLCGLHALYLPQVRKCLDLKIYMDIDETLRQYWKLQRDTVRRGYSKEKVLKQIEERLPDAEKYIHPQKKYADLAVTYFDRTLETCLAEGHEENLSLRLTLDMDVDLEALIEAVEAGGIHVVYDYDDDLRMQSVVFEGNELRRSRLPIAEIADKVIPHLDEIISHPLELDDNMHGILAIILLMLVSRKLQGDG